MHEPATGRAPQTSHLGGPPAGIAVHLEYRVRSIAERRRRVRRRGDGWPYYERRRRTRRLGERRLRRDSRLDRAALEVLRRVAVLDEAARRLLARVHAGMPQPDFTADEPAPIRGVGPCSGR